MEDKTPLILLLMCVSLTVCSPHRYEDEEYQGYQQPSPRGYQGSGREGFHSGYQTVEQVPVIQETQGDENTGDTEQEIDLSKIKPSDVLGKHFQWDGDNSDIDDIELDDDEEDDGIDVKFEDNDITPEQWVPLLDNYVQVLSEYRETKKIEVKKKMAKRLQALEQTLVDRRAVDFEEEEPERFDCAKMEFDVVSHIRSLPPEKQTFILDLDHDGKADFIV